MLTAISFLNKYVFGVGVPVLLILLGMFYCIRLKFFHLLHPVKLAKCIFGRESTQSGGVSSAKALMLALAGTLGVGNMVGVASAIALGGAGAIFWMWVSAFVAMILKYSEIVLALVYRKFDLDGRPYGAAMYYIRACFKGKFGLALAAVFAVLCVLNSVSMGSMIQVNAAASAAEGVLGMPAFFVGLAFAFLVFYAVSKGTSGVVGLTERLVPIMTAGFLVLSVAVICARPVEAADALGLIFKEAFTLKSGMGGIFGFLLSNSLRYGTMRGILSNEAGCGTAPAAHAVSDCKSPARQGVWGILEVFVDTILLCTLTAVVILVGGEYGNSDGNYMMLTLNSYKNVLGGLASTFVGISVILFGLATLLCWGFYGLQSVSYLTKKPFWRKAFVLLYSASTFFGAVISPAIIWELSDLCIGAMTFINLTVLCLMNGEVKRQTEDYFGI